MLETEEKYCKRNPTNDLQLQAFSSLKQNPMCGGQVHEWGSVKVGREEHAEVRGEVWAHQARALSLFILLQ